MIHYFKFFLRFVRANFWLYYVAIGITVVFMITLVCCEHVIKRYLLVLVAINILGIISVTEGS